MSDLGGAATRQPRVLLDGLTMAESARWHQDRLWFAHWASAEILAVDLDGKSERIADGPPGYGWSIDWLPDGRRLATGERLLCTEPDGTVREHGRLPEIAAHGWNEIAVAGNGDVYVNGFSFDLAGGGAPQPGIIALVRSDGSSLQAAADLQFPNGMLITPDGSTLIVSESFAGRLTAFTIESDGTLTNRRVWAEGVAPDGIVMDREGAIWCGAADIQMMTGRPDDPAGGLSRVLEGGVVTDRIELDRPCFSCTLGGPDGTTLFMLVAQWRGFDVIDQMAADRTAAVLAVPVAIPG
jgi:sugar lactone lactonase YvrE